jgi:hypothetical protein
VAREAVHSLGRVRDMRRLPWLVDRLSARGLRDAVRQALRGYGPDALLVLDDAIGDAQRHPLDRRLAVRVLGGIPRPETAAVLLRHAEGAGSLLRDEIFRQLHRLRLADRHLRVDRRVVHTLLQTEAECYYALFQIRRLVARRPEGDAARLLARVLAERLRQGIENVFALLSLLHPPREIEDACRGVLSGRRTLHANAVAYLEQILEPRLLRELLPMIERESGLAVWNAGRDRFGVALRNLDDALEYMLDSRDPWLRCCAAYYAGGLDTARARELLSAAAADPSPVVRETVELVKAGT